MAQVGELPVKVLLTCAEVGRTTAVGRTISRLTLELERLSAVVIVAQSARDAMSVLVTDPDVPVAVVDWDLCEDEIAAGELLERLRRQADDLPVFLMVERGGSGSRSPRCVDATGSSTRSMTPPIGLTRANAAPPS